MLDQDLEPSVVQRHLYLLITFAFHPDTVHIQITFAFNVKKQTVISIGYKLGNSKSQMLVEPDYVINSVEKRFDQNELMLRVYL